MLLRPPLRVNFNYAARRLVTCRRHGSRRQTPVSWRNDTTPVFTGTEDNFAKHTVFAFDLAKRVVKFSSVGILALGITGWVMFEGVHMWVEHVELALENDQELRQWEWDLEAEKWSGDSTRGGTDPALGFIGRHTVRAAWMAQNWGTGYSTAVIGSNAYSGRGPIGPGSLNVVDARLEHTEDFLRTAISIAERKNSTGKLHHQTLEELLARHATALERMGSPESLSESRFQYERVWTGLAGKGINAARTAAKLGDLNHRLGHANDALDWWSRAIQLTRGGISQAVGGMPPVIPESPPTSPLAQRTLISTLVSLSAFYATSRQLRQAQATEETSLKMLGSIRPPESLASASPPQALHALYLLHRSSLISIHLAEVLFAQRNPVSVSIQWLGSAAESSERVAYALTGLSLIYPNGSDAKSLQASSAEAPLLPVYSKSHSMRKTATSLLRDARRTAAEAWNLMGTLNELSDGSSPEKVLRCYERAIGWAGVATGPGRAEAAEGTLESDWRVLWGNYCRARNAVERLAKR